MAKTSQVNRNAMRERMAKRDKAKRAALKAIVMDRTLPVEDRFNASLQAGAAAAQRRGGAGAAALRADRPLARQLPQVQAVPHQAA